MGRGFRCFTIDVVPDRVGRSVRSVSWAESACFVSSEGHSCVERFQRILVFGWGLVLPVERACDRGTDPCLFAEPPGCLRMQLEARQACRHHVARHGASLLTDTIACRSTL